MMVVFMELFGREKQDPRLRGDDIMRGMRLCDENYVPVIASVAKQSRRIPIDCFVGHTLLAMTKEG